MQHNIFEAIREEFGRDIFTVEELATILINCGHNERQVSAIIREAIKCHHVGVVSFKQLKRKPAKNRLVAIL